jgi:predicted DNA-binding protein (MmcQ/YjbR family)
MAELRAQLRAFALSLPGAAEDFPWGERVAKVNGKIFVFLGHDEATGPPLITVNLIESHDHALSLEGAGPSGYGLGCAGWVNVPLRGGCYVRSPLRRSRRAIGSWRRSASSGSWTTAGASA